MNYLKIYNDLINKRKNEILIRSPLQYVEQHHIVPRCMGGSDDPSNLVNLTAREHFIAHALLLKIYPKHKGICNSFRMMGAGHKNPLRKVKYFNSRLYQLLKHRWVEGSRGKNHPLYGVGHKDQAKEKISQYNKNKIIVKDKDGNRYKVSVFDERYLSGELVHHSKDRVIPPHECLQRKIRTTGLGNPNAKKHVDDLMIIDNAVKFYLSNNEYWIHQLWKDYCRKNNLPYILTIYRLQGRGYKGVFEEMEKILGKPINTFAKSRKKYHEDKKKDKERKNIVKIWMHNDVLKSSKQMPCDDQNEYMESGWVIGRKNYKRKKTNVKN